jgi:hypothetical protein
VHPHEICGIRALADRAAKNYAYARDGSADGEPRVDLYWLPLGAGGRSVRLNGRLARRRRRR